LEKGWLGHPETFDVKYKGKYDFVVASGLLAEGHATKDVFEEMIFALKPKGYAIFTSRVKYLKRYTGILGWVWNLVLDY
jgi:hypothetical protein